MSKHRAADEETGAAGAGADQRPVLRIVNGNPSAEELAVLTAVLTAAGGEPERPPAAQPVRGRWNDPAHLVRRDWPSGPGAWRAAR